MLSERTQGQLCPDAGDANIRQGLTRDGGHQYLSHKDHLERKLLDTHRPRQTPPLVIDLQPTEMKIMTGCFSATPKQCNTSTPQEKGVSEETGNMSKTEPGIFL